MYESYYQYKLLTSIVSPLDQFKLRNLISIDAAILDNTYVSISNIGLYLIIAMYLVFFFSLLYINYNKISGNS